jgi:hypothetical protein
MAVDLADAIGFVDGQFRISNDSQGGGNIGGGFRWLNDSVITGTPRILGVTGWYDGQETTLNNYFNQMGVSFESLGEFIDLRLNANIPLEERKLGDQVFVTDALNYSGNSLSQATLTPTDVSLRVVDAEVAARVFDLNAWFYGGAYQMDGDGISETGAKGGVRGYVTNDLALDVGVSDDQVFGTNTVVQVIWTPGRTGAGPTSWLHTLADRMREQVYRNTYIATERVAAEGSIALTNVDGEELRIVHVDSSKTGPGDGTFENPFTSLNSVNGGSQQGDIILVHSNTTYAGQSVTLKDEQRLLGEGENVQHLVVTSERGSVALPESSPGANALIRPLIQNAAGDAIVLASTNGDVSTFSAMEVSNFDITGGNSAIDTLTGVGAVNISGLEISNTSDNAIDLSPLVENLANGTRRVRFSPNISNVTFSGVGGDDIHLDALTAEPTTTPITEAIAVSNITSTNGNGVGVALLNTKRTASVSNLTWNGGTTGEGALRIEGAGTQGNVNVTGTNTITGGVSGVIDEGYAIAIVNSAAAHSVVGTTIIDTGGDSVIVDGSSANLTFTGRIEQGNDASVVSVSGGHTGTLIFNQLTAGQGVINATDGDGLQFDDADGAYTFNHEVVLNGGDAGIDVLNGSDGTFTFANANIDYSGAGNAVTIDGSLVQAFTLSGDIATTGATSRPVAITDNTAGSITFNAPITATNSLGILVQDNVDTTVLFNGQTTLNTGANDAVTIANHTSADVRFNNIDITTTSGNGFVASGSDTVTVAAGSGNTISTTSGVGLSLTNVQAGNSGVTFQSVNVSAGGSNGIVLNNVTGGLVTVTGTSTTDNSGGSIVTEGDAVLITNAARVSINNMSLRTTGVDGNAQAVDYNVTNGNQSRLLLNNNNIVVSDAAALEGVLLNIGASANRADITLTGNDISNTGGSEGLRLQTANTASLKTVNLLAQNNTISTNSAAAADRAANFQVDGGAVLNATVLNNTFNNTGAGSAFEMATVAAGSQVHLDLNGNMGNSTPVNSFLLVRTAGTYTVKDLADVATDNTGGVSVGGGIVNEAGTIPQPQAP